MSNKKKVYCCGCRKVSETRITDGLEIYPHREDLGSLLFYVCDVCNNYVGCHKESKEPYGCIPTPAIREARKVIHRVLDPLWKQNKLSRKALYERLSTDLGYDYHTANVKSITQANRVLKTVTAIAKEFS